MALAVMANGITFCLYVDSVLHESKQGVCVCSAVVLFLLCIKWVWPAMCRSPYPGVAASDG